MGRQRSATSLVALGLLSKEPLHGHELRQRFEERGISAFTSLTAGALYHALGTLESDGLIEMVRTERVGARPERTVYRITEAGRAMLREEILATLRGPERIHFLVDAALSQCAYLPPAEVIAALEERRVAEAERVEQLEKRSGEVKKRVSRLLERSALSRGHGLALGTSMIRHAVAHARAELGWLEGTLKALKDQRPGRGSREERRS